MIADVVLADAAPVDDTPAPPHRCCAEYGIVTACDTETQTVHCVICGSTFQKRCPEADLLDTAALLAEAGR